MKLPPSAEDLTIRVTIWAAQRFPDETAVAVWEVFDRLRLGTAFYALAFVAIGLYGIALRRSGGRGWG